MSSREALELSIRALVQRNSRLIEEALQLSRQEPNEFLRLKLKAIADLVLHINEEPQLKAYEDLPLLADCALAALTGKDEAVRAQELFEKLSKDIHALMKKTPNNVNRGMNLILLSLHLFEITELARGNSSENRL